MSQAITSVLPHVGGLTGESLGSFMVADVFPLSGKSEQSQGPACLSGLSIEDRCSLLVPRPLPLLGEPEERKAPACVSGLPVQGLRIFVVSGLLQSAA